MGSVSFKGVPADFDAESIVQVQRDNPLYELVDPQTDEEKFADVHFALGMDVSGDQVTEVLEALRKAAWSKLEFYYALDRFQNCSDFPKLVEALSYAKFLNVILFNRVRAHKQVQAGRLHKLEFAVRIARQHSKAIEDLFDPAKVHGEPGFLFIMKPGA